MLFRRTMSFERLSCFSIVDVESEIDRLRIIKGVHVCGECYARLADSRYRSWNTHFLLCFMFDKQSFSAYVNYC